MSEQILEQARRVLTPWFGGEPLSFPVPDDVPCVGVSTDVSEGRSDEDVWMRVYQPMYGMLAGTAARQATALFGAPWTVSMTEDGLVDIVVIMGDPATFFESLEAS